MKDLQPYSCTYQGCKAASEIFTTRREWSNHEAECHALAWPCSDCNTFHESWETLKSHMRLEHGITPDLPQSTAPKTIRTFPGEPKTTVCRLCFQKSDRIQKHMARHLRTIALFVLPSTGDQEGDDILSNEGVPETDENSRDSDQDSSYSVDNESLERPHTTEKPRDIVTGGSGRWADFDLQGERGTDKLLVAATNGNAQMVDILVEEKGINVNATDSRGQTALSRAAERGHKDVVQALLKSPRVDPEQKDKVFNRTPLSWAAGNGHADIVNLLLRAGSDVNSADSYGRTALWRAAAARQTEVCKELLKSPNIDVNICDRYGRTPLRSPAAVGHMEIVDLLSCRPDVDINVADRGNGQTPLHRACETGQLSVVKTLLRNPRVNINSRDINGHTPLVLAATTGRSDIVEALLDEAVQINQTENQVQIAIEQAIENGHAGIVELLKGQNLDG